MDPPGRPGAGAECRKRSVQVIAVRPPGSGFCTWEGRSGDVDRPPCGDRWGRAVPARPRSVPRRWCHVPPRLAAVPPHPVPCTNLPALSVSLLSSVATLKTLIFLALRACAVWLFSRQDRAFVSTKAPQGAGSPCHPVLLAQRTRAGDAGVAGRLRRSPAAPPARGARPPGRAQTVLSISCVW